MAQQVVVELFGRDRGGDVDEDAIRDNVESRINDSVSVSTRQGMFDADKEVVVVTGGSIVLKSEVQDIVRGVRQEMLENTLAYTVDEWRVECV